MPITTETNGGKKKRRTDSRLVLFTHRILVVGQMYLCVLLENRPPSSPTSASNSESPSTSLIPQPPLRTPRFPADFFIVLLSDRLLRERPGAAGRRAERCTHGIVFICKVTVLHYSMEPVQTPKYKRTATIRTVTSFFYQGPSNSTTRPHHSNLHQTAKRVFSANHRGLE